MNPYERERYDFHLPDEYIATHPTHARDSCRLMVLDRTKGTIAHKQFFDIKAYFREGDVLILNDSKVLHARLRAVKETGGKVEVMLVKKVDARTWHALTRGGRVTSGSTTLFLPEGVTAHVTACEGKLKTLTFSAPLTGAYLDEHGEVPLPPYIVGKRKREGDETTTVRDNEDYQNVFARNEGSVAAPTSGLHFTQTLLDALSAMGVRVGYVTLHIGYDTFTPIEEEDIREHVIHKESYSIPDETIALITKAKTNGGRVIACGTTVTRTLESAYDEKGCLTRKEGDTELYIYPPYTFRVIDALITNFHTPRSTLLALVSAFAGYDVLMAAYRCAIEERYRFFSYGDAMFII